VTTRAPLDAYLDELRQFVETGLTQALASSGAPDLIADAMRYSLMSGGKRLRPCLTLATAEATGTPLGLSREVARTIAMPAAVAVEMIHTYSLIHDDLPAMDDDALRRGRPTSHIVHGEGLAILAGDGLLTEAFRVLAGTPSSPSDAATPEARIKQNAFQIAGQIRRLEVVRRIAVAAGSAGMVGGQAIDLAAAGRVKGHSPRMVDAAALEDMHARKTGALIRTSTVVGALMVGANEHVGAAMDDYARELGLAFQIIDDVLDVEGSNEALGKTAGKDAAAGKPTYPSLYGVTESRRLAAECVVRARAALARVSLDGRLAEIAEWSLTRQA
jgi:geranylgeranyl pyrophosphate synthase